MEPEWDALFGPLESEARQERSPDDLVESFRPGGPKAALCPRLRFDCGLDDSLLAGNRSFHARLQEVGIPHTYLEYPGAHTWDYWARRLPETLGFVDAWFRADARA